MNYVELNGQFLELHDSTVWRMCKRRDGALEIYVSTEKGEWRKLVFPARAGSLVWSAGVALPTILGAALLIPDVTELAQLAGVDLGIEVADLQGVSRAARSYADGKWCVFFTVSYGDPFAVIGRGELAPSDICWDPILSEERFDQG